MLARNPMLAEMGDGWSQVYHAEANWKYDASKIWPPKLTHALM